MADDVNDKANISFLTFGNQDLPAFVEVKGKKWIYYGEKNDYPYYLIDLYTQSAYHKAIIDGKVAYIAGNGWGVNTAGMKLDQRVQAERMLEQPFGSLNLNEATQRWATDLETFNGFCVVVNWDKGEKGATLEFIDMANIRTNADESEFYYTRGWFKQNNKGERKINNNPEKEKDFKVYPKYDPKKRKGAQIYYWKAPHPDQAVYPLPVYKGAVTWINVDVDLAKYFFHTVNQAFVATHLINFNNGEPNDEKKKAINDKVKQEWTTPQGNRIITSFNQNKESAATVETLQMSDADKQYEAVRKYSEQAIFTGHRVTSGMLFGIYREGTLGGRSELMFAEEHFQNSYISTRQAIIEGVINELAGQFGIQQRFYLNKVSRVGYMLSDSIIEKYLTEQDVRSILHERGILKKTLQTFSAPSEEDETFNVFSSIAFDASDCEVLSERVVEKFDRDEIVEAEKEFLRQHFVFEIKASALERSIVDLLSKDPTLQPEALAKATKSSTDDVTKAIQRLVEREILIPSQAEANGEPMKGWSVSETGVQALEEKPAKTARTAIVYRYGLAPRFEGQGEIIPTTRDFCRKMVELSKSGKRWKSEDIFALDPGDGINPWLQRGGWYTRKDGTHVPQCRHAWIQQIVKVNE